MSGAPGDRLRASWDTNAAAWTEAVRSGAIASRRLATDAAVIEAALTRRPASALDVGCGEGWLVRVLAARGVRTVGVDGSEGLVAAARAYPTEPRPAHVPPPVFETMTYEALAAGARPPGAPFGVVVCNFALLGDDLAPLLRALRGLLAPDGALVVQTVHPWSVDGPYTDGWRTETFAGFPVPFPEPMPWFFRTLASWSGVLRAAGFVVERIEEPVHPDTLRPLSLLVTAVSGVRMSDVG